MKYLSKTIFSFSLICLSLGFAFEASAVTPISFEGPKITYDRKLLGLGDFAVYNFMGQNKVDAAVPSNIQSTVVGMDNLNQWTQAGPNVFYSLNPLYDADRILKPLQVLEGNFNGSGASDLVVLNPGSLTVCKDYTGAACGAGFSNLKLFTDGANWHAAVGKLRDGKDAIAVITQGFGGNSGKLVVYQTDPSGEVQDPYYNQPVPTGAPFSLAIGDYDNDGKLDVAVASRKYNPSGASEVNIYIYKNNGSGFEAPVSQFGMKDHECYTPTGLLSYDPDGDSKSDLVLTCYDRIIHGECIALMASPACFIHPETGYVYLLKNTGGSFNLQHTINNDIKYPYSSAVGKFNGDGLFDVAVANRGAKAISVYAGNDTFKTEDMGKDYVTRFDPTFIQVADKNGDALQDIISVATSKIYLIPPSVVAEGMGSADDFSLISEAYASSGPMTKEYIYASFPDTDYAIMKAKPDEIMAHLSDEPEYYAVMKEPNKITYKLADIEKYNTISKPIVYTDISETDSMAKAIKSTDKIKTPDAVLVLINYRPQVSFDPVNCATTKVIAHCQPTPGHTITPANCVFNSADIPAAVANVQKTVNGSGVDLTFNLPQEERTYTATVTGTDETSASVSETIVIKREGCTPPQTAVTCPPQRAYFEVWVDDPFQMCAPLPGTTGEGVAAASTSSAYSVDFTQTGGPNMFAPAGTGSHLAAQTITNGNCLTGRFAFPNDDIEVSGTYKIKNNLTGAVVAECPWGGKVKAALLSGSGVSHGKCSLVNGPVSIAQIFSMLSLLSAAICGIYAFRKKQKIT